MNLFEKDPSIDPRPVLNMVQEKVTEEMDEALCKPFSDEEISNALFQIGPLKAPGPYGFPAQFFQHNWAVLKDDKAVKRFFEDGHMPEGVNDATIVMIQKISSPEEMKDFRPISLCNIVYKVVSKCLVNRLRIILDELILEARNAFIPGRLITDNALIASSVFMQYKNAGERIRIFVS